MGRASTPAGRPRPAKAGPGGPARSRSAGPPHNDCQPLGLAYIGAKAITTNYHKNSLTFILESYTSNSELMPKTHYRQFCALARAAEILGERWTLLIVRELLLGPKRFSDLRDRLDGVSSSVLAERLMRVEELGLVRRSVLEPPAASVVYELTEAGLALKPAIFELIRWGGRLLLPRRRGDRVEPDWMRLALAACARRTGSPSRSFLVRIPGLKVVVAIRIVGGPEGTSVMDGPGPADTTITAPMEMVLGLMSRRVSAEAALAAGQIAVEGDRGALSDFSALFDVSRPRSSETPGQIVK